MTDGTYHRSFFIMTIPFSTPTKNAVNKSIIERCIFFPPPQAGEKIYAKNLKFCIAAGFVVCQLDNHVFHSFFICTYAHA